MGTTAKYDAFISYSSRADGRLAPSLHRALERFAKPWYRVRESRIFYDNSGLSVTEALWPRLQEIIRGSEHFLLLASPEAARSEWVKREVAARIAQRRPVLIVLTDGQIVWDAEAGDFDWQLSDALPRELSGHFDYEPLYIDLRWAQTPSNLSLRHPRFHDAVASLAATIRGIDKDELSSIAVTQQRKTMRLAWSTVALLVALLAGAVYQTIAVTRARDLADQRLQDAIGVAEQIVFSVDTELASVAGGSEVRKKLLEASGELLEKLRGDRSQRTTRHVKLTRTEVAGHQKRGILALTNDDLALAQTEFELAYDGAKALVEEHLSESLYWQDLAHAAERLGAVYRLQGKYGRCRQKLEHALDVAIYLTEQKPHISRHQWGLASVYTGRSALEKATGNVEAAEREAKNALDIELKLAKQFPNELGYRSAAATTLNSLGDLLLENAEPLKAKSYYSQALALRLELLRDDRENAFLMGAVAASHSRLGRAYLRLGDLESAEPSLASGLELASELVDAEPDNTYYLAMQAVLHDRLGQVASRGGDMEEARRHYQAYGRIADSLVLRDAASTSAAGLRINSLLRMGDFDFERAEHDAAGAQYALALEAASTLADQHSASVEALRLLALAHDKSGNVAMESGEYEIAKGHYLKYLEHSETLFGMARDSLQFKIDMTQAHGHLAELELASRELEDARLHYDKGLQLAREIMSPGASLQVQRNLWSQLLGMCKVRFLQDDVDGAKKLCQEALTNTEILLRANPDNPQLVAMHEQSEQYFGVVREPQPIDR